MNTFINKCKRKRCQAVIKISVTNIYHSVSVGYHRNDKASAVLVSDVVSACDASPL